MHTGFGENWKTGRFLIHILNVEIKKQKTSYFNDLSVSFSGLPTDFHPVFFNSNLE
jgi:hypothetical protein